MTLTVEFSEDQLENTKSLLEVLRGKFNQAHQQQFSFSHANAEIETMHMRAKVIYDSEEVAIKNVEQADSATPPEDAIVLKQEVVFQGKKVEAIFWDRTKITKAGFKIYGSAVITEMDSNTLILPGYFGEIHCLVISSSGQ